MKSNFILSDGLNITDSGVRIDIEDKGYVVWFDFIKNEAYEDGPVTIPTSIDCRMIRLPKDITYDFVVDSVLKEYSLTWKDLDDIPSKIAIAKNVASALGLHSKNVSKLDMAKETKLEQLMSYDTSSAVDEFFYNGEPMWMPLDKREGARGAIQSRETLGQNEMTYTLDNGMHLTLPLETWKYLLAMVECYAQDCYNVTAQHAANIKRFETIEEVMGYDYTTGYPDKIHI